MDERTRRELVATVVQEILRRGGEDTPRFESWKQAVIAARNLATRTGVDPDLVEQVLCEVRDVKDRIVTVREHDFEPN